MMQLLIVTILCFTAKLQITSAQSFGKWAVKYIGKCPDNKDYKFEFDVTRHKCNRTHDAFYGWFRLDEELNKDYGVKLDVCRHVDGGCKPYYILSDENFCAFIEKYCKDNMERIFEAAGIPIPICPLKAGKYEIPNYVFNYEELPEEGMPGLYGVKAYVLSRVQTVACVELTVEFTPSSQGQESDEDE